VGVQAGKRSPPYGPVGAQLITYVQTLPAQTVPRPLLPQSAKDARDEKGRKRMADAIEMPAEGRPVAVGPAGTHGWSAARAEWRENWRVGLASFLAIGLSFGAFQSLSSLFVMPLQAAFGWSRGEIAFAYNAALVTALAAPFVGRAVDRFGPRRIMIVGMTVTAALYMGLAAMNGSLFLFYALQVLASVIGLSASGLTCSRVVSEAFVRSRGLSLAVARSGLSLASAALPTLLFAVIAGYGWCAGYLMQAALVLVIALPAVFLWIGRKETPPAGGHRPRQPHAPVAWANVLRNRRVWILCLGAGLGYAPANAIMSQLLPMLVSKEIEASTAAGFVGVAGVASFFGAIVTGSLVDRFWAPGIAFMFACGSAAGTAILALNPALSGSAATLAVLLVGLGLGAEIDVVAYMVARYFGLRSFSTIYGLTVFFIALSSALGASFLGFAFDRFGGYDGALLVIAVSFFAAGCLYLLLGPYPVASANQDTH
jgi:MFS family permease